MIHNMGSIIEQMQRVQRALKEMKTEVSDPTGIFRLVINGHQEVVDVKFDPAALNLDKIEELQSIVAATFNLAVLESKQLVKTEIAKMTQGMNLPNIPGMF